ncbi:MAG: nucleotidyl transferase AbiEii/AbiGii toxin family protein, partial [Coprobacillus cateniformis]
MKNAMQLKSIIKNLAREKHISAQLALQNFMLERMLERISESAYQKNFILKGGFLIASIVGLDTRTTMDMDATIRGLPVNEQSVREMFEEICRIKLNDDVSFTFRYIEEIREGDEYTGYRVALTADYSPMSVPLKLDITTGDKITPKEIEYKFKLLLEDRSISVLAYNLETVLAEKLETVISRGDQNTRPRDYYDVYI